MKNQDQIPLYAGNPIAYSLKPVRIKRELYNSIESSLTELLKQLEDFTTQVLSKKDKKIFEVLGLHSDIPAQYTPLGLHIPFARFDFVLDPSGKLQVLELNTDGTSSWNVAEWVSEQGKISETSNPNKDLSRRLLEGLRAHKPQAERVVILDFGDVLTKWEQDDLVQRWQGIVPTLRAEPDQRSWEPGALVYRRAVSWTLRERARAVEPFLSDWREKKITVVGGWSSDVGMSKAWPVLLKSSLVAETISVNADVMKLLKEEQVSWVIKSAFSHSGKSVMRGGDVTPEQWALKLREVHERGGWVAQRVVEIATAPEMGRVEYGMFFINGRPAGIMARAGHKGAITDTSDDLMHPVWVE